MADTWGDMLPITDMPPELAWIDLETTGLDPNKDVTLELGIVLTDAVGRICRDGVASWLVYDLSETHGLDKDWGQACYDMSDYVRDMHVNSGLNADLGTLLRSSGNIDCASPAAVAAEAFVWLRAATERDPGEMPMSGSSVHFDRSFVKVDMPELDSFFHYRNGVDVSSLRELAKVHAPNIVAGQPTASKEHRTVPDLLDSIKLYRHLLKSKFIKTHYEVG